MLGAVQFLPTCEALTLSERWEPTWSSPTKGSLHPINVLQLWLPFCFKDRTVGPNPATGLIYTYSIATLSMMWVWLRRRELGAYGKLVAPASVLSKKEARLERRRLRRLEREQRWCLRATEKHALRTARFLQKGRPAPARSSRLLRCQALVP